MSQVTLTSGDMTDSAMDDANNQSEHLFLKNVVKMLDFSAAELLLSDTEPDTESL